jgi:hypothetical protein
MISVAVLVPKFPTFPTALGVEFVLYEISDLNMCPLRRINDTPLGMGTGHSCSVMR